MDPEDLREVISSYQKAVAETVGETADVAMHMGNSMVYFGLSAGARGRRRAGGTHRAGVDRGGECIEDSQLRFKPVSALRLDWSWSATSSARGTLQERGIVGETPNLAARLQGIAEPGTVAIAESTRKLLGGLFDLQDLGTSEVQRHRRTGAGLCGTAGKLGGEPLRGVARLNDTAGWSTRGDRAVAAPLGAGKGGDG